MMVNSDLRIDEFKYEGSALGNWELGGVCLPVRQRIIIWMPIYAMMVRR